MLAYRSTGKVVVRQLSDGAVELTGLAAPYERYANVAGEDRTGHKKWIREKVAKGAFRRIVNKTTQTFEIDIPALINHQRELRIARTRNRTLQLKETEAGLEVKMRLDQAKALQRLILRDLDEELITGLSIGFALDASKKRLPARETQSIVPNVGEGIYVESVNPDTGIRWRILRDVDLKEVSVLTDQVLPAYSDTYLKKEGQV